MLDTSVLVAAERRRATLEVAIDDDDDVAIAAVTAAELWVGVELADARRRARRATFVEQVLETIPVEDYDLATARVHAGLLAEARRRGRPRGAHDLLIAATAVARGRTLVTFDRAGFEGIEGLTLRD
ncbi:MAG TPA: PIN domain-containing protein [Actinomycetota bacterium]|nr:PIN domain-containing protein [Actinomycetota bacterium]